MYAIIQDSGSQMKVSEGDVFEIDLRDASPDDEIKLDRVLMVSDGKGTKKTKLGTPYIDGAFVTARVVGETRGRKIDVIKFKRRKGYRRQQGHRQRYLTIEVLKIKA